MKNGRLEVVPEEAEVVRMIFHDYLSGMGRDLIVKKLVENKIPSLCGGQWWPHNISVILRNECYVGDLRLQKTFISDHLQKKKQKNRGELPQYLVTDGKVSMPYKQFLGYRKGENGEPEIVPEEAEIVRRIYRLFLEGQTPYGIKRIMEMDDIPTPGGKQVWQTGTIMSILSNEKYKGDALLQKTFCTDFLTKKMKVNEGEVPQYYGENSHPAIVSDEMFDEVQQEITRRKQSGRQHNGTSSFAGKIFCGCCGAMYASKVWHSNDKYQRVIWQCNAKFKDGRRCKTPHLTESIIQQKFLAAMNQLLEHRDFIIEDMTAITQHLTDTAALENEAIELHAEMDITSQLVRQLIEQNASMALNQAEYEQRYQSLSERFNNAAERVKTIEAECVRRTTQSDTMERFMNMLMAGDNAITEFSQEMWNALLEKMIAQADGSVNVVFKNRMEITV